jgi:hypothetical protein
MFEADYSSFIDSLFDGLPINNPNGGPISSPTAIAATCRFCWVTRRLVMMNRSKFALIAALVAMSAASPAFAQSFNKGDGTGNSMPFAYGPGGTKPAWTVPPQNEQIAVRQSNAGKVAVRQTGHNAFAAAPRRGLYDYAAVPFASGSDAANSPAATGGGSTGYNEMLLRD